LVETAIGKIPGLRLVGGHLALDLVNSVGGLVDPDPSSEFLRDYGDLLAWSRQAGALDPETTAALARRAQRHKPEADKTFARALELRALADRVLRPVASAEAPRPQDMAALTEIESAALAKGELAPTHEGFTWRWADTKDLETPLWPLAHAIVDLLTEGRLERLRGCANCRWLFLDESRNGSRRWCSMEECGTDVKKRRYVERRRERRSTGTGS
jgi:predicted RNA-binding Zn ribbon-like protein